MSRRSTRATISVAVSLADASRGLSRPLRSRVSQMLFGIAGVIAWTGRGVLRDVRAHELTHRVRERVRQEVGGVAEVLVHVEPNRSRTTRRTSRCGSHARAPPLRRDATP